MTTPDDLANAPGWTCSRCGSPRPPTDGFCGLCGARMPKRDAAPSVAGRVAVAGTGGAEPDATPEEVEAEAAAKRRASVVRSLVLAGIPLVGVVIALLVARPPDGPSAIKANPTTWHCGEGSPSWTTPIRAAGDTVTLEWREASASGPVATATPVSRYLLDAYRQGDGTYIVPAEDVPGTAGVACQLPPGAYALVVVDGATGLSVAEGPITLAR